ncbi:flagellin [Priestia megaterium]|uniref:flagellin N-terminal helical domain-containing protein n=1 Tax=Priestia megaterium TaxID=1404 RepID=UPI000BECCCA9|nr:flagellin [Priestia megaterium]PEC45846.1 flagellin [Priestia megaterium]
MRINHNIAALNTYRQFNNANNAQSKSMEKLSSGLRINSAADDAAGLAISEKMRGQIRGLDMASKNAQDATSLIQTAEGALNETHDILQRQRELATQAATDTNTDQDRQNIQDEMNQLGKEIDRIAETTQFNTKNLLDGSMDKTTTAQANIQGNAALKAGTSTPVTTGTKLDALTDKDGNSLGIQLGDTIEVSYVKNGQTITNKFSNTDGLGTPSSLTVADLETTDGAGATDDANFALTVDAKGSLNATASTTGEAGAIHGFTITVKDSSGNVRTGATNALSSFAETQQATDVHSDGSSTFQIGANTGQNINLAIKDMGASALGVKDLKVGNQGQANVAIKVIDEAIKKVSTERSNLGATQNRLDHTINNLNTSSENLTAAESRIRDVDYALAA